MQTMWTRILYGLYVFMDYMSLWTIGLYGLLLSIRIIDLYVLRSLWITSLFVL